MKGKFILLAALAAIYLSSCGQTTQKDNTTNNKDTMVIDQNHTDSATKGVSTDTTKR